MIGDRYPLHHRSEAELQGQAVGSLIRVTGRVLGVNFGGRRSGHQPHETLAGDQSSTATCHRASPHQ